MHTLCDNKQRHSANTQLYCHKRMIQESIEATYEAQQLICGRNYNMKGFRG